MAADYFLPQNSFFSISIGFFLILPVWNLPAVIPYPISYLFQSTDLGGY